MTKGNWIALGCIALVIVLPGIFIHDCIRATEVLRRARVVRDLVPLALPGDVDAFLRSSDRWSGNELVQAQAKLTREAIERSATPAPGLIFFGSGRANEVSIASASYAQLALNQRGTWMTYQVELAALRTKLDTAVIALEQASTGRPLAGVSEAIDDVSAVKKARADLEEKALAKEKAESEAREAKNKAGWEAQERERLANKDLDEKFPSTSRNPIRIERSAVAGTPAPTGVRLEGKRISN